jgi:hypothetical protein
VLAEERLVVGAGSFVAAPPGVALAFTSRPGHGRLLNVHAPSSGFHEWLRENSVENPR